MTEKNFRVEIELFNDYYLSSSLVCFFVSTATTWPLFARSIVESVIIFSRHVI